MKSAATLKILCLLACMLGTAAKLTAQVNVAIQILPPYPTKFTDYASRPQQMIISLTNVSTVNQRIQLRGSVTGDNNIVVRSKPGFRSNTPIELGPGQTRTLNGSDIASFFNFTDLEYTGITQNEFINKGGLPEGRYQLCIRAFNYDNNEALSADEPSGCSNTFTISSLEPPVILSPMADEVVSSGPGQIFSIRWNMPVSAPPGLQYRLRMVEILGNRNPNDAIMTATQPYFFEKELNTNMYVYNPADPQLTPGRKYALMVEAFDPFGNAVFRNNGRSEVVGFEYGKLKEDTTVIAMEQKNPAQDTLTLDARIVYRYDGSTQARPYTGKVYIYKSYLLKDTTAQADPSNPVVRSHTLKTAEIDPNENELVGSGEAGENGNIHIVFGSNKLEAIPETIKKAYPGSTIMTAVYTVRLGNPYLNNPEQKIVFASGSTNAGELTAIPNSYALRVNLKKGYAPMGSNGKSGDVKVTQSMAGLRTVIYRKTKAAGIPLYEGGRLVKTEATATQMMIVAEDTSTVVNDNGKISAVARFDQLLVSKNPEDTYWIAVFKPQSNEKLIDEPFKFESSPLASKIRGMRAMPDNGVRSEKVNQYRYNVETSLSQISNDPPLAKLRGRILYRYRDGVGGARPLANKAIRLVPVYVLSNPVTREQYVLGSESAIVPVGSNNQEIQGEPEKAWKDLPKINGDINGVAGQTGSDGSFVMNEIPLWDSVMTFNGLYNIRNLTVFQPPPQYEMDRDQFENPMVKAITDARDSRINPGDQFTGVFNPVQGYDQNSTGLIGGGVTGLNSTGVVIGGSKAGIIASQVNALQGGPGKVAPVRTNQRGGPSAEPLAGAALEARMAPQDNGFVSPTPLTLQRCYRVMIDNEYYFSPDNNIFINPLDSMDAGTLYSDVRSYKIRVTVVGQDGGKRLSNVRLELKRYTGYDAPQGEGDMQPERGYEHKGKVDYSQLIVDGMFSQLDSTRNLFNHVLYGFGGYNIVASTNDTINSVTSYKGRIKQVHPADPQEKDMKYLLNDFNNTEPEPIVDYRIVLEPKNPVIAGRLLNADGVTGINGSEAYVTLQKDATSFSIPVDKDGYFVYAPADQEVLSGYTLSCGAWGYEPDHVADPPANSTVTVNGMILTTFVMGSNDNTVISPNGVGFTLPELRKGQKVFKNIYFKPQAQLKGTVVNAQKQPIPAIYKVSGSGTLEETRGTCNFAVTGNNTSPVLVASGGDKNVQQAVNVNAQKNTSTGKVTAKPVIPAGQTKANPVSSAGQVKPVNGQTTTAQVVASINFQGFNTAGCTQEFNARVASGKPAELIIIPNDLKYFNDTIRISNPAKGITDLGERTLVTREHRMNIYIRGIRKNGQTVPLANASVKILDTVLKTVASGGLIYSFANISQQNFWLKVTPPPGTAFVPKEVTLTNTESKGFKTYFIDLVEGDAVWGTVTMAGKPLPNAEVSVSQGIGAASITVKTGTDGSYRIEGIRGVDSAGTQVRLSVSAGTQPNGEFVAGQSKQAAVNTAVNFELSGYSELDVSRLLGYEIKVTGIEKDNDRTLLSGELLMPANSEFKPLDPNVKLSFSRLPVKANTQNKKNAKGIPYAEPEGDIVLDNLNFKTLLGESYNVIVGQVPRIFSRAAMAGTAATSATAVFRSGLAIKKQGALNGALSGKAKIVDNSFNFPESYLKFGDSEFYLSDIQGNTYSQNLLINNTTGAEYDGPAPAPQPHTWHFSNASGGALQFKFLGFSAVSEVAANTYSGGRIRIKPTITAAVETPDNKPLVITMPEVSFNSESVAGVSSTQPIEFALENWKVKVSKWKVATEEGGILALGGSENYVSTSAGVNISFKTFRLRNDELLIGDVNLGSLKLGGIKDLKINPGNVTFGLDNRTGNDLNKHYVLRLLGQNGQTAGRIENLPGFAQALDLEAVTLISNGEQYIDFAPNSATVKVYNIIDFKPIALEASQGGFRLSGSMNLGIPNLAELYGGFLYTAGNGPNQVQDQLDLKDLSLDISKGYVKFSSLADPTKDNGRKVLRDKYLEIWGTVTEPGKLDNIPVRLTKVLNGQETAINIEQRPAVFAMKMSGEKMTLNLSRTWTRVQDNQWDYLQFTGTFDDNYQKGGMGKDPLTFKVYGEIAVDDTNISIKDIETPVGSISLVFDWPKKEMRGSMQIQTPGGDPILIPGGIKFKGMAETLLGANGFYFVLAGDVNVQSVPLIFPLSAGILIAYHDHLPKEVFDKASQYMYHKTYPCGLENGGSFKGFMLAGRKNVIDPVDFSIDVLGIASANINLEVGFDATFYGNFSNGVEVSFTPGVFGDISLGLSSPMACVDMNVNMQLSAMGRFLAQIRNGDATFTGALCMSLHMDGKVLQKTPALPPLCGPVLLDFDKGFTIGGMFGLRASTAQGGKIEPFFKVIKSPCSENMNLLCN